MHLVAVLERDGDVRLDRVLGAVERGAVGGLLVDHRPAAVGLLHQHRVLVRDARVLRRHRQVDVRGLARAVPAAADGDLGPGERQTLLGEYAGRFSPVASGPLRCIIARKYSRSGAMTAVQDAAC